MILSINVFSRKVEGMMNIPQGRIKNVIETCLDEYVSNGSVSLSGKISENVKSQVKQLVGDRYKVIVEVFVYENRGQSIRIVSKCLWDENRDTYVCAEKTCDDGITTMVAVVYCIYFD